MDARFRRGRETRCGAGGASARARRRDADVGRLAARLLLAACLPGLAACTDGNGTGNDGGDEPQVDAIEPTEGRPGDRVAINGDNFGRNAEEVTVTFGDSVAEVDLVLPRRLTVFVPDAPEGTVDVFVSVEGNAAEPVAFTILRGLPEILGFSPTEVRAGEELTLSGRELHGGTVAVVLGPDTLSPSSVTDSLLTVLLSLDLDIGNQGVRVLRDGLASNSLSVPVQVFTVTGSYAVEGTVLFNSCPAGPPVGSLVSTVVSVTDSRPIVALVFANAGAVPLQGILETSGAFDASQENLSRANGRFAATAEGEAGFNARLELRTEGSSCRTVQDLTATRTSTSP